MLLKMLSAAGAAGLIALTGAPVRAQAPGAAMPPPPPGEYYLDKPHTSVTFRVSHLGFSHYTARFSRIDGRLQFDPAHPEAMGVEASIDPTSLELNAPPAGFHDQLMGEGWFEAAKFPAITFRSTRVALTSAHAARVTGDLTLHGVTRPVTLEVTTTAAIRPRASIRAAPASASPPTAC